MNRFCLSAIILLAACDVEYEGSVDVGIADQMPLEATDWAEKADSPAHECQAGESQCVAAGVRVCLVDEQQRIWAPPSPCPENEYCRLDRCRPATALQQQQIQSLQAYLDEVVATSGWVNDISIKIGDIKAEVKDAILKGDESDATYFSAARTALLAIPVGHNMLWSTTHCGTEEMPWQSTSRLGVCAQPYGDHFIVTFAQANNPLGINAGDQVHSVDGISGKKMVDSILRAPVCGSASASDANAHAVAATSLFGVLKKGAMLQIETPSGAQKEVSVKSFTGLIDCRDPFSRNTAFVAKAYLRADGVGVIRLPRFTPLTGFKGNTRAQLLVELEALKQQIANEFALIKNAPGVVWDLRGNIGGATPVTLAIVGGMPTATPTSIAHCDVRIPFSNPPQFYGSAAALDYEVQVDSLFAYPGKVAIITDALTISAGDYFALATSLATNTPIVGAPTAGSFGGSGREIAISTSPSLMGTSDPNRCVDTDSVGLEGRSVHPTHPTQYAPKDLANGIDTLLEAAAMLVISDS
jgi:C-terminal processing protease CtpA/Prc